MKMDPKTGSAAVVFSAGPTSGNSKSNSGTLENGKDKENVFTGIYESAHFANIFVEFENDTREMAIDVPDHFIATTKTPPKYPPPLGTGTLKGHTSNYFGGSEDGGGPQSRSSSLSLSNGHHSLGRQGSSPAPTPASRNHLKIEEDGRLMVNNNGNPPPIPSYGSDKFTATPEERRRMKKYGEGIAKRAAEDQRKQREDEFLRHSIRNSQKMRALKEASGSSPSASGGFSNSAFSPESSLVSEASTTVASASLTANSAAGLMVILERLKGNPDLLDVHPDVNSNLERIGCLLGDAEFQKSLLFAQKVDKSLNASHQMGPSDIHLVTYDCINYMGTMDKDDDAEELRKIISKSWIEALFAHDKVAVPRPVSPTDETGALVQRLKHYAEPNIKIVRIEKSVEPLGATVKNEGEAVLVGRIIRGGTAEASGLLHEGDELLEVNEIELRGKDVNDVCDILANLNGTLTFLVVPTRHHLSSPAEKKFPVVHVKAHIDYDPEDDPYVPCRELGISFQKGDILHVVNQRDAYWWQARRDGEEDLALPGLIPSAHFLQQREAMKNSIALDVSGRSNSKRWNRTSGFLCAKRSGRSRKNRKMHPGSFLEDESSDGDSIITYEEVALYYPRAEHKRPVVLIGPPNIGRHELRQRLMLDQDLFAAAIPHTSRPKRANEVDGQDYHFISRLQFEQDILARRFVEHGEYEKAYYGTSLEAIRSVVQSEKICVLNLHPQSLKMLKSSKLMPYVVFVAPPSLDKLKRWKMEHSEEINDDELKDIIERAREMEEVYGHYFDMFITYSDPERAYQQLLSAINSLEREPQWVPAVWLQNHGE